MMDNRNKIQMKSRIRRERTRPEEYKANELTRRMWQYGYKTVSDFCNNSDITKFISKDQLMRLIMYDENVPEPLFILVADYFRFDKNQISKMLEKRGYKSFKHLIGDHPDNTYSLRDDEKALLEIYRHIAVTTPINVSPLINFLDALCTAAQIDCKNEIEILLKHDLKSRKDTNSD